MKMSPISGDIFVQNTLFCGSGFGDLNRFFRSCKCLDTKKEMALLNFFARLILDEYNILVVFACTLDDLVCYWYIYTLI